MATRRFLYWRDPLCIATWAGYWLNRELIKPLTLHHDVFFHGYFNDLICVPCFLPLALFVSRKIGLRRHDAPPTPFELITYWAVWSIFFEVIGPRLPSIYPNTVADPWDVLAYAVGTAVGAVVWWSPMYARLGSVIAAAVQRRAR